MTTTADQNPDHELAVDFAGIVAGVLETAPSEVTDAAGPDTLWAWTSLRHLQLIVTLEEAYGVSFSYREIRDIRSIGHLRAVLRTKGVAE
jgi:acyl carrier protein